MPMKVFVAGTTGAIGIELFPDLAAASPRRDGSQVSHFAKGMYTTINAS